jgi:hypothetical protein
VKFLQTGIPASGNRWVRAALGIKHKAPWEYSLERTEKDVQHKVEGGVWGHFPPTNKVLIPNCMKIYVRRKSIKDQLVSYTHHPGKMKPPPYLKDYQPYTELENAMRTCAPFYKLMQPWEEHADYIIYYEDMCENWYRTLSPILSVLCITREEAHERVQAECGRVIRRGCPGIGQYKAIWNEHYQALYDELFNGL